MTSLDEALRAGAETGAERLVGCVLRSSVGGVVTSGRIVETEAYLAEGDAASHAFRGATARNASMFGRAGTAYVYLIYGMHHCVNVVTGEEGVGEAVLIRALEPLEGLDAMRARRGERIRDRDLCRGPGRLCEALGIGRELDGVDLTVKPAELCLEAGEGLRTARSPRIGITKAAELPLRFVAQGEPRRWASR